MARAKSGRAKWLPRLAPAVLLLALAPAARADHPLLAESPSNQAWHAPAASDEVDYIGEPATQIPLVLKKALFTNGVVTLAIGSDADRCILRCGSNEVSIDLIKDKPSTLRLDGNILHPRLEINGQELAPLRGHWIRLLTQGDEATLSVVFVNAKYVNLEYHADRAAAPVPMAAAGSGGIEGTARTAGTQGTPEAPSSKSQTPPPTVLSPGMAVAGPGPGILAAPLTTPVAPNVQSVPAQPAVPTPSVPVREQAPANTTGAPLSRYATPSAVALPPDPDERDWRLNLKAGVDVTNAYFYRGIGQEDKDPIVQPWFDVDVRLYNNPDDAFLNSLDAVVELWNSFDFGPTGTDENLDHNGGRDKYYEERFSGGIELRLLHRWLLGLDQQTRLSPNAQFSAVHQADMRLTFDDHSPDYDWQLWPYIMASIEYEGQSDAGNTKSDRKGPFQLGDYIEVGVRPEFGLYTFDVGKELTMAVPVAVGFSAHDYYQAPDAHDNAFGFADAGTDFSLPLLRAKADGGRFFRLDLVAGLHMLVLGETAREISKANHTSGDTFNVLGSLGLVFSY